MHVLFVHKEYPGHFGHVAAELSRRHGIECTILFNSLPLRAQRVLGQRPSATARPVKLQPSRNNPNSSVPVVTEWDSDGVRLLPYASRGISRETHPSSVHFEMSTWHSHSVLQTLQGRPDIRPDLVVGHGSYGNALQLGRFFDCPTVNYCEFYVPATLPHLSYRPEFPAREQDHLTRHAFNAINLLCLEESNACYSPTDWQKSLFPQVFHPKIRTIPDGIDRHFWYRRDVPRSVGSLPPFDPSIRIVTYCAYGLEPLHGFDIFMKIAKRICDEREDVVFVVIGADIANLSTDRNGASTTFGEHVFAQGDYDRDRFFFTGQVLEEQLADILSISDLHVYLTVPFVLSWSLMNALACGCPVVASDTPPVREILTHEVNGLLADFDDVDGLVDQALRVLDAPDDFEHLAVAGTRLIDEKYRLEVAVPQLLDFFRSVVENEAEAIA